jgi:L-fuculose-phosphate aldolase
VAELDEHPLLKSSIIKTGCALLDKGLVTGTWGNVSARLPGTKYIAVTPSGRSYHSLAGEDIVITDLDGKVVKGRLTPSSELPMHLAIYQARTDVDAIIHTHSVFASSCAVARKNIPPIIEDLVQMAGGSIDVAEYALPGTRELADNVVRALGIKRAALLANHGMVCCAHSLSEALLMSELVEKAAQIYIYAQQAGGAYILDQDDVRVMHEFYLQHYRRRQEG